MSHLCLQNSSLIDGEDFSENERVNAILADPTLYPVVLYPGPESVDLTRMTPPERRRFFPADREPVVFLIDATWAHAKRMRRLSQNLRKLPTVCFTPPTLSSFHVRQQPRPHCYSTIESIHLVIELFRKGAERPHDNLLQVFAQMVQKQIDYGHLGFDRRAVRGVRGSKGAT